MHDLATLNFGSNGPIPVVMEDIHVQLDPSIMVDDYARAFVEEAARKSPLMADRVNLTAEEMINYARYLLRQRVLCIENKCADYRNLKLLYIPSFLQYAISMVGDVVIRDRGLHLIPEYEEEVISFSEALKISNKVGEFDTVLQVVRDAMPRDSKGDVDTMSTALIASYARSLTKVQHEASVYIASFLGFKLKEEQAMKVLYRVQYDDINYIISAIMSRKEIL
jgi:hypothetical protein